MKRHIILLVALFLLCSGSVWAQPQKLVPVQKVHMKDGTTISIPVNNILSSETYGSKNNALESDAAEYYCQFDKQKRSDNYGNIEVYYTVNCFLVKQGRGEGWFMESSTDGKTFEPFTKQHYYKKFAPGSDFYYRSRKNFAPGVKNNSDEEAEMYVLGPTIKMHFPSSWKDYYSDSLQISYDSSIEALFETTYSQWLGNSSYYREHLIEYLRIYYDCHKEEMEPFFSDDVVYDDGVVRFLNYNEAMFAKFYEWFSTYLQDIIKVQEIPVITDDTIDYCLYVDGNGNSASSYYTRNAIYSVCKNLNSQWDVPNNCYLDVQPNSSSANPRVGLKVEELVVGRNYKVTVVFAPDTIPESEDHKRLPTRVQIEIDDTDKYRSKRFSTSTGDYNFIIPCEETTTFELGTFTATCPHSALLISTNVTSAQKGKTFNRIIRLAKVIITPVEEAEE